MLPCYQPEPARTAWAAGGGDIYYFTYKGSVWVPAYAGTHASRRAGCPALRIVRFNTW